MENERIYFCPPKLTTQYRVLVWNIYDVFIGLFIVALGLLWFGVVVFTLGAFFLLLKAYITDEKSVYVILKSIFIYIVRPNAYGQYLD